MQKAKADCIHKLKISAKEANETEYWLKLYSQAKAYPDPTDLLEQLLAIQKLAIKNHSLNKTKYS